jgi:iron(III) transport system permease protein
VRQPRLAVPIVLTGGSRWVAAAACAVPIALGFVIPAGFLAREVVLRGLLVGFDPGLLWHTLTTVTLAAAATVLTLMVGLAVVVAVRLLRRPFGGVSLTIAGLGYAVPGTVLALGLLSPLVAFDNLINAVVHAVTGAGIGLVVAGSGAAVVIAYVIRFLAIATGSAQAGLARISTDVDDVARTLGARPAGVVRFIHLPLARPALAGAALLIFVDCLKELPATLLLRPMNVETLSTYIYQFATRGNFEEGALAALIIVAVGVLPVIYMVRYSDFGPPTGPAAPRL